MPKPVTSPGIDAARLKWLLDCESAIKSMAAQFLCPKVSPQQLVKDILKGEENDARRNESRC